MLSPSDILKANPGLKPYLVSLHEEKGDKFTVHFECYAENFDHAEEQAESAYPGCEILIVMQVRTEDLATVT